MDSRPQPVGFGHAETAQGSGESNLSYKRISQVVPLVIRL